MANQAKAMYSLNHDQTVSLIKSIGHKRTVLVEGHMGTGKSSLLRMLSEQLPDHIPCYFDCTTKDLGDITVPDIAKLGNGSGYVEYLTNEELGAHHDKPIIVMLDEFGKSNPSVKLALTRFMLERAVGSKQLHPDSTVFATTNLGAENVGDMLQAHQKNRIAIVTMRKPDNMEWIEWGINNEIDHTLLGWCKDNPQLFHTFEDIKDPSENHYIYHPQDPSRTAFVTPRSLEAASDLLKVRDKMDSQTVTAALMGMIGERAAMDLMSFVKLADQLPSLQSIKDDPKNAKVPDSAPAVCMVVYRSLSAIERNWVDAWVTYMKRLSTEAQGLFVNGVRNPKYSRQQEVMTNKLFTQWAIDNRFLFASDKK